MSEILNVTPLDFDTIKANLKTYLKAQSEFQDYDFDGSGLSVLLDILAYNTHYNSYYLNMLANESFLDSAMLRKSVVSHAKRYGYVPRSINASRAVINVSVEVSDTNAGTITIPKGYRFVSNIIDGSIYNFCTNQNYTVSKLAGSSFYQFNNVVVFEGNYQSYNINYSQSSNPRQIFEIPDANVDTKTLTVMVKPSPSSTDVSVYNVVDDVLNITATSEVYFLQEGQNNKYQIYFGDGVIGKALPDGAVVILQYIVTNGAIANGANSFLASSPIGSSFQINSTTVTNSAGGASAESVDDIKFSAPLQITSHNRAVTKNDYINLIKQKYPAWESVNVWGGEENDPPVYGKIFISGKPRLGFEVTDTEKEYVKNNIIKPISVLTVTPEIVDVDYNYLRVESTVFYDPSKTTLTDEDIKTSVRNTITNYCSKSLDTFNSYFKYSGLETTIDNSIKAILSNEVELMVAKKFRPNLIQSDNYVLDFGFELMRGTTSDSFFSNPTFTMLDEEYAPRECYFEEIPSSFSGIESIIVSNAGYGYITSPTVEIFGDGTGATAKANIVNGKIQSIDVLTPGYGYTSATVRITGGGGQLGNAIAVNQGRYGQLRIAYYKPDAVTGQNTKFTLNSNNNSGVIGTIDYLLGKIYINKFNPISVNNSFGDITMYFRPKINIIQSKLNKMLVLDAEDNSSIVVKTYRTT